MSGESQRSDLQGDIWKIANDVRGSVDGWDFKHFVLGTLFYRFMSENFSSFVEGDDSDVVYSELEDDAISDELRYDFIVSKGYYIAPSQLFVNVAKSAKNNSNLNIDLANIFMSIEASAVGFDSEDAIKGLFADFDTTSNRLGNTVEDKNSRLCSVIEGIARLKFGSVKKSKIDLFGDAYEFLISNYAANAGRSGGEFFTPQEVSNLIARLASCGLKEINKVYDPTCGSGSLLLQVKKGSLGVEIADGFFGQEINHTTYNLARMNMFLHDVNYDKFNIVLGNTLINPAFEDEVFDVIVSNPPYSINWVGSEDPTLINDDRFSPAGVLAPKSKADLAFIMHSLKYLSGRGRAAIVCFPGVFYRGGAEMKIRQYLVDHNFVESVISLPSNLFFGTSISVSILVLSKSKVDDVVQFIDASGSDFFVKRTNNNKLEESHIASIVELFNGRVDKDNVVSHISRDVIMENDYNLSVSSYVEPLDESVVVNIGDLNKEISATVAKIDELRLEIDKIVREIELC